MIQTDLYSFSYKKGAVAPYCKRCGSGNFIRDGKDRYDKQIRRCKTCGYRFVWSSDFPKRKFFSNVMALATELYSTVGISLRTIAKKFKKYFGTKFSHECVRKWVLDAEKLNFVDDNYIPTKTWHIDETYIRIKGKGWWLWVVYCKESKHVIAWRITKTRLHKDAYALLKEARAAAQGIRPEKIITDGLWQYQSAIKKVLGWNWKEQKKRHIIDSGIGKNAIIERVNKEIKRRYRWFGSFQCLEGAEAFFKLFFHHLNRDRFNPTELT